MTEAVPSGVFLLDVLLANRSSPVSPEIPMIAAEMSDSTSQAPLASVHDSVPAETIQGAEQGETMMMAFRSISSRKAMSIPARGM